MSYRRSDFETAFKSDQISIVLEPQINLVNYAVEGFECLARWNHPEHGRLTAASFVPDAEACGMISELSAAVFAALLRARQQLQAVGYQGRLSMNLSQRCLENMDIARRFAAIARAMDETPKGIVLEITESSALSNALVANINSSLLVEMGFEISMDDFWTGYSSIDKANVGIVSEVKIDRTLTEKILNDRVSLAGVASIIALANNLGWRSVVEGVESREVLDRLKSLGCGMAQGHHFSKPLEPQVAADWYRRYAVGAYFETSAHEGNRLISEDELLMLAKRQHPGWLFNVKRLRMEWANRAAVKFWEASSLAELKARDMATGIGTGAVDRLKSYQIKLEQQGKLTERWSLYPKGISKSALCVIGGRRNEQDEFHILVEAYEGFNSIPADLIESEILSNLALPCIYTAENGAVLWMNPAAVLAFGREAFSLEQLMGKRDAEAFQLQLVQYGDLAINRLVKGAHCSSWNRIVGRRVTNPLLGANGLLLTFISLCDTRGCTRSSWTDADAACEPVHGAVEAPVRFPSMLRH